MNGDEYQSPNVSDFNPSWMEDGGGIIGEQTEPDFSSNQAWDTNAWSRQNDGPQDDTGVSNCTPGDDTSKSYVQVKQYVDGHWKCIWTETTTCP